MERALFVKVKYKLAYYNTYSFAVPVGQVSIARIYHLQIIVAIIFAKIRLVNMIASKAMQ